MAREGQIRLPGHDPAWLWNVDHLDANLREEPKRLPDSIRVRLYGSIRSRSYHLRLVWSWIIIIFTGATATGTVQALFRGHW